MERFILMPDGGVRLDKDKAHHDPERAEFVYRDYRPDESVLRFRNFLTLSTTENFNHAVAIDHSFYVSKITTMNTKHFNGAAKKDSWQYPYKNECSFYINLSEKDSREIKKLFFKKTKQTNNPDKPVIRYSEKHPPLISN